MPPPVNPHFNPPANTWQDGKFTVPQSVMDMLAQQRGTGLGGAVPGAPGQAPAGGAPANWSQYLFSNPDVMDEWRRLGANPKNPFKSADEYAQWHYGRFGRGEGRQGPPGAGSQPFVDRLAQQERRPPVAGMPGLLGFMMQNAARR